MRVAQYLVRIRIRLSASLPVGRRSIRPLLAAVVLVIHLSSGIEAQETPVPDSARPPVLAVGGDSVSISLVDVELRVAVQALGRHLDRPLLQNVDGGGRVTLETPRPVPRAQVASLLRALVQGRGYEFVDDSAAGSYLVRPLDGGRGSAQAAVRPDAAPASLQGPALYIIRLSHARAIDVAATINALYGQASALGELGSQRTGAGPTLGQQLQDDRTPGTAGANAPIARGARLTGEMTIVPDQNSNALFVRASAADFELIRAAVDQLDVRPLQVLIEVIIAEVRRDRSFSFGVEAGIPQQPVRGATGVRAEAAQAGIGLGDFALRVLREGSGMDFDATLRASAARGDARILSRPVVLATNGETAEILVGSQRPFVQVQRSLPTDAPQRDQVVQYRDVGTRLSVRPVISADGYVSLAITQEVNAATSETQFDAPVISTRTVQTVLLVRDSQTVVLGGLSDRQREASQSGVPILSSIPLLGGLFGRASRRTMETEFFLFLRPHIIQSDQDADDATSPYRRDIDQEVP